MRKNKKILAVLLCAFILFGTVFFFRKNIARKISVELFKKGDYYFNGGSYNIGKAEKYYSLSIKFDDSVPIVHYQLGRIYFIEGNTKKAKDQFDLELEKNPDFKRTYYMRGLNFGYDANYRKAIEDFKEFLKWKPDSWAAANDLSWIYLTVGDWEEAFKITEEGLRFNPGCPWLLANNGTALLNLKKYSDAKEKLIAAREITKTMSPDDWAKAYPGNDPRISQEGFSEMKAAINLNISLVSKRLGDKNGSLNSYNDFLSLLSEDDSRRMPFEEFYSLP